MCIRDRGEDDPYWTEAPELGCTAAVETEVETAKASEDIAATVAAEMCIRDSGYLTFFHRIIA